MSERPWGPEPPEPPPEWHDWLLDRKKALAKEAEWKEFADKKKGVEDDIIRLYGASHQIGKGMIKKFQDGVGDPEIPERLGTLWWEYDRYVKHSGSEYENMRAAALDAFDRTRSMEVEGYWRAEQDLHRRYPNPNSIEPFNSEKIRLAHRLLKRAWAWDLNEPYKLDLWNRLLDEFAMYNDGYTKNLFEFRKDIERLVAALPPEEAKGAFGSRQRASVVDAVFEAHALKGRVGRV